MKRIFLINLALLLTLVVNSQAQITSPPDTVADRKNEVWLNVLPFVAVLAQMPFDQPHFSVMYKRKSGKIWLRAGAFISPAINRFELGHPAIVNDSTVEDRVAQITNISTGGRVGVEFRRQYKVFQTCAGADVVYMFNRQSSDYYYSYYRLTGPVQFPDMHYDRSQFIANSEHKFKERKDIHFGGIGLTGGAILPLSRRLSLSAQANILLGYARQKDTSDNLVTSETSE